MIWFEVSLHVGRIEKVEVERYTSKSVWVKRGHKFSKREARADHFSEFHPTFEEARASARKCLLRRIEETASALNRARSAMSRVDSIEAESLPDPPKYDQPLFTGKIKL